MKTYFKPKITLFHCVNAFKDQGPASLFEDYHSDLKIVAMPCSGMTKDIFLLKAFEAGSDGVIVLVCPEKKCRYVEGSARAKKRVQKTRQTLEEIEIDGHRLVIFESPHDGFAETKRKMREAMKKIYDLGPLF